MNQNTIKDLGDGLVLCRSTPTDTERLVTFQREVHHQPNWEEGSLWIANWARDLLTRHPTFDPGDFTYVKDTRTGEIVPSLCLISQFPDLTFLHLLFGHRSLSELDNAFADCRVAGDEPRTLLEALFPKQPSDVWPLS